MQNFLYNIKTVFLSIGFADVIDILIVTALIYYVWTKLRGTGTLKIALTLVAFLFLTAVTGYLHLRVINFLLEKVAELGIIALVIVFQPELRRMLERVWSRASGVFVRNKQASLNEQMLAKVVSACETLSRERTGALIVFERAVPLDDYLKTGTAIDAEISPELIRNLFFTKAALHDGAVIIRNGRIAAAGCVLPLTEDISVSSDLGTRHRAGKGMSEKSDAVVIIVSEETGHITVAEDGMLKQRLSADALRRILLREMRMEDAEQEPLSGMGFLKKLYSETAPDRDKKTEKEDKQ